MQERLQKIISAAGIMSRRAAEELITEGRVRVNGVVVAELGSKADPEKDHIKVDGKLINPRQPRTYVLLNKPVGYVTTLSDPEQRPIVQDLLKGVRTRVYPVGRLDYNTEGLLLLTNDGDFAHLITHPSHELPKTYLAKIKGSLDDRAAAALEQGVYMTDGKTAPAKVRRIRREEMNSWVEITIHEGRKRQVRRMFDHVGHSVIKLKRVRVGSLKLGDLPAGGYRHLTADEVASLREMAEGPATRGAHGAAGRAESMERAAQRPASKEPRAEGRGGRTEERGQRPVRPPVSGGTGRGPGTERPGRMAQGREHKVWSRSTKPEGGEQRAPGRSQPYGARGRGQRPDARGRGPGSWIGERGAERRALPGRGPGTERPGRMAQGREHKVWSRSTKPEGGEQRAPGRSQPYGARGAGQKQDARGRGPGSWSGERGAERRALPGRGPGSWGGERGTERRTLPGRRSGGQGPDTRGQWTGGRGQGAESKERRTWGAVRNTEGRARKPETGGQRPPAGARRPAGRPGRPAGRPQRPRR